MDYIIKIFQIESDKECLELSEIEHDKIKDFGNGFFVSKNGYIASVSHVLYNKKASSFALYKEKLWKIKIMAHKYTENDKNHIDAAIGKIDIEETVDYYNPNEFEEVIENNRLELIGYSRELINVSIKNEKDNKFNSTLVKLNTRCIVPIYKYPNNITMINFFTFFLENNNYIGLSGSPVINENKRIVGILKGGAESKNKIKCQILHIKVINKMLKDIPCQIII
jgi:Trypsin-like peptidase domain